MKDELIKFIEERQEGLFNERQYPMSYTGSDVAYVLDEVLERIEFLTKQESKVE